MRQQKLPKKSISECNKMLSSGISNYFSKTTNLQIKNPNQIVYYTNLAQAYRANNQFQQAIKTIDRMQSIKKPMIITKKSLIEKGRLIKARCINSITKKYIISNEYSCIQTESMINLNKKSIQILQQISTDSTLNMNEYLTNSLKISNYFKMIKQKISQSEYIDYLKNRIKQSKNGLHNQKKWQKIKQFVQNQNQLLKQIQGYYKQHHQKFIQQSEEEEQYIIDPISYEIYKEPVIVPSGLTYEKEILMKYFQKGQEFKDPITKQKFPFTGKVLVYNLTLEKLISETKKRNQIKKQDIQLLVC